MRVVTKLAVLVAALVLGLIFLRTVGVDVANRIELDLSERDAGVAPATQPAAVDVDSITPVESSSHRHT